MMGLDTTFLVQLEIQEAEAHDAALEAPRGKIPGRGREAALAPQVLGELVHVVTDARRFGAPTAPEAVMVGGRALPYRIGGSG